MKLDLINFVTGLTFRIFTHWGWDGKPNEIREKQIDTSDYLRNNMINIILILIFLLLYLWKKMIY